MSRPKAETDLEWRRQIARDQNLLKRQGRGADLQLSGSLKTGLLDDAYRGQGAASVLIDDWGTEIGPLDWLGSPYIPSGSREVTVVRSGGRYQIFGQQQAGRIRLPIESNWLLYNERHATDIWLGPMAERLPSGFVILSGLITTLSVPAADSTIAILPPGYRPDTRISRGVNQADVDRAIYIEPDGRIRVSGGSAWTASYVSLDGIGFWADGTMDWQAIGALAGTGLVNGWVDYYTADPVWGHARVGLDAYGFTWLEGLVSSGVTTDNTPITALPAAYRTYAPHHCRTVSNAGYGMIGSNAAGDIVVKANTNSAWVGLGGVPFVTAAARANNPWRDVYLTGGWSGDATYTTASILRRGDGLATMGGLIRTGTIGSVAFVLEEEEWVGPGALLMSAASLSARGRLDIKPGGLVYTQQGNAQWFVLDGRVWMPR